jgi:allantoin racemase
MESETMAELSERMRIAWHVTLTTDSNGRMADPEPLWTAMADYARKVARPTTDVELRFLDEAATGLEYSLQSPLVSMVNGTILVEDVRKCAAQGFDAVLIAAVGEPALDEARAAVGIPVAGSLEAALALSQCIARRVGIVTISPSYTDLVERNIARYRLTDRLIERDPVRHFAMSWDNVALALAGNPEPLVAPFDEVARGLVQDGAEAILMGGQIFGALVDPLGYDLGDVPVVDCATAGIKMLEALTDLRRAVGLRSTAAPSSEFRRLPADDVSATFNALAATTGS